MIPADYRGVTVTRLSCLSVRQAPGFAGHRESAGAESDGECAMFPVMRLVFAAVGALLGAGIAPIGGWFFAALVGACIGFAIAEFTRVRGRILSLEEEVAKLRAIIRRRDTEAPAPARPEAPPAMAPESPQAALDELRLDERSLARAQIRAPASPPAPAPAPASAYTPTSTPPPPQEPRPGSAPVVHRGSAGQF